MPSSFDTRKRKRSPVRATLIHNPSAGDEHPKGDDLVKIIESAGFQVRYESTEKDWKKALKKETDLAIAAGGDGTVAKVLKQLAGSRTPVALLPIGTANNVGRSLGITGDARKIVESWKRARPLPFDLGLACLDPGEDEELFVEACGGGLFAAAIKRGEEQVEDSPTFLGNEIDRGLALLHALLEDCRAADWSIEVDGADHSGDYLAVEVMNIRFAGPGVPLAPNAVPGDGSFEVVLVKETDRTVLLEYLSRRLSHDDADMPQLTIISGRQVHLTPPDGNLRVDDEIYTSIAGAVDLSVMKGAVRILGTSDRQATKSS
jgi:diacylglycerol kinase family enzyme